MAGHCPPPPGTVGKPSEGSGMVWDLLSNMWTSDRWTFMWKDISICAKKHTHTKKRQQESNLRIHSNNTIVNTDAALPICACEHMLLPKSVMRMGSCRGMSGRGRLLLDTLALLVFRGNLCFFCCKLLKWEAMCVFLWPDVRKILSQWGQGKGRAPG